MDWIFIPLLAAAGLAGGVITAIVGGSSLIVFPVMLAAGLPPILASTSSTIAMTPSSLAAALADRERIPPWNRSFIALIVISFLGTVFGAVLLLLTNPTTFTVLVPVLIGGATALFAFSDTIKRWIARRAAAGAKRSVTSRGLQLVLMLPIAIYGGYFGAAMSVMVLAVLSLDPEGDFRTINTVKNILSTLVGVIAAAIFLWQGMVAWPPVLTVMVSALVGGFLGGKLVRVLSTGLLKWIVILVGSGLAVIYAVRYWRF